MSTTPDSALADPQQIIADLKRQLAENNAERDKLRSERDEAVAQQVATAEVLGLISSSPGDLALVFEAMLEKALRLCGADFGMTNTYDGQRFHHAADCGVPPEYAEYRRQSPMEFGPGTGPARSVAGENVVENLDLKSEPPYELGDPNRRALVDLGGARSHVAVALRKDGVLLGHLAIYRQEVRAFTDKQIALLQNFAAQARSSLWRTRGSLANCAPAPTTCRSRSNTRPRPATF